MSSSRFTVVVRQAYAAQYADPITFRCGDEVEVERRDPEFTEWFWCRGPNGREGWVHRNYLSQSSGRAVGICDYSAKELTVSMGEMVHIIRALDGWAYVELPQGRAGWVPEGVLHTSAG